MISPSASRRSRSTLARRFGSARTGSVRLSMRLNAMSGQPFSGEVFVVEIVGDRNGGAVPLGPPAGLVTSEEEDGPAQLVENEQHPQGTVLARPPFLHVLMAGRLDPVNPSGGRGWGLAP